MIISKRGLVLGGTAIVLGAIGVIGTGIHLSQSQAFFQDSPKELIDEVWQIINGQYVDSTFNKTDWQQVRKEYLARSYKDKEEAYKAIREMLAKLNDPYTRFMDPKEFQNMQVTTSGELTGVGIQIAKDEETKEIVVISPIEGTPAFNAGILAKDTIVKIDGKSTKNMEVNDVVNLIRGKEGTNVTVTIRRGGKEIDYPLVRKKIQIHPVRSRVEETNKGKVAYIRLTEFSGQASKDMESAIVSMEEKKVIGYIIDLRSNPGGLLYASIDIARMLLQDGTIVSTVDRKGGTDRRVANQSALTDKPLVVLVDGGSASASEILSGALQDNKRAIIVGTKTFGKGLVQSVQPLRDGSGMAVTISKYLTPSGRDIHKHGIDPDVVFNLTDEERKTLQKERDRIGTKQDPQFTKALVILEGEIAKVVKGEKLDKTNN
jgi:carboxyl-terminal processing protease